MVLDCQNNKKKFFFLSFPLDGIDVSVTSNYHAQIKSFLLFILQVGDSLPSISVMEGTPNDKVNVADLFGQKKGILFGVPGAFTPGCTKVTMATAGLMQAWWTH